MTVRSSMQYMEGQWAGERTAEKIEQTTYKTLELAIKIKQALINVFEEDLGFTPDMEMTELSHNDYARELGMLESFKRMYETSMEEE